MNRAASITAERQGLQRESHSLWPVMMKRWLCERRRQGACRRNGSRRNER